jgi:hypothetical protein
MTLPLPYHHTDGRTLHLGLQPSAPDPRDLKLSKYTAALPPPPEEVNWYGSVTDFGQMYNDSLGDCTIAAYGHGAQVVTLNTPTGMQTPPDDLILNLYEKSCGYVPGDPSTDNGGIINHVLNYARKHAMGHKHTPDFHRKFPLLAYAAINPSDTTTVKQAVALLATVDIGLNLPVTCQAQIGSVWDVVGDPATDPDSFPNSWGGHSVIVGKYNSTGPVCITWGAPQQMSWSFWSAYCVQSFALLYAAWLEHFQASQPEMLAQLQSDLLALE